MMTCRRGGPRWIAPAGLILFVLTVVVLGAAVHRPPVAIALGVVLLLLITAGVRGARKEDH